jgi:hypothetical protein
MRRIYQQASEVIVWLGIRQDQSELAFEIVRTVYQLRHSKDGLKEFLSSLDRIKLQSLAMLFVRPFWSCIWVVQEVALAKQIMIYCEKDRVDWSLLYEAQLDIWPSGSWEE